MEESSSNCGVGDEDVVRNSEWEVQTVPSSDNDDDDDDDDGESLMVQFDLDSDKKRIPLGSSSSPELPPPKGLSQEQVALAAATTDDDELRPESDYVKEEHFSRVSSCVPLTCRRSCCR
ncbi:unnamed protein product [Sphagnum jensenii]|uniref:Uncharacterized protein n=1 Tax=Sphagnum jensenii TaxID=128206 RepID=A0ABP1AD27_9BRYO